MMPGVIQLSALPAARAILQSRLGGLLFPSDKSPTGIGKVMGYVLALLLKILNYFLIQLVQSSQAARFKTLRK